MTTDAISVTTFRANIYALIDRIGQTGQPQLLVRNGELYELRKKSRKRAATKEPARKRNLDDIPERPNVMTEPPEWYISPKLYEWKPDDFS